MEYLKEVFEEYASRSRSHFFGAIAISFLAFNWQPLYFVVYADIDILDRFAYFDRHVKLWQPIVLGTLLALATPMLTLAGSWWAEKFTTRMKKNQNSAADEVQKHNDALRQDRATATVEHGQDLDAKLGEIEDEEVRGKVRESALSSSDSADNLVVKELTEKASNLTATERLILVKLNASIEGDLARKTGRTGYEEVHIDGESLDIDPFELGMRAIKTLQKDKFIEYLDLRDSSEFHYRLTSRGHKMAELLKNEDK